MTPSRQGLPPDTFAGLTVVDLSRLLPGPYCTQLLADHGARVISVEAVGAGDYARWYPPRVEHGDAGYGAFFAALHRGKESCAVNLKHPDGVAIIRRLIGQADVLVEGFRPGVLERLGLDIGALQALNPQLIVCRISGFGQQGGDRLRAGHDLGYMARSGVLSLQSPGQPGTSRAPLPVQVADIAGGALHAAFGIAAALYRRARTFQGAVLDIAMVDGALHFLATELVQQQFGVSASDAQGLLTGGVPCYRVYMTADGRGLAVAALEPHFWEGVCHVIGRPDLAAEGLAQGDRAAPVIAELEALFASKPLAAWVKLFASQDLCVEPVASLSEVSADPTFAHRQALGRVGAWMVPTPPTLSQPPKAAAVPLLGEHSRAIARALGFTSAQIDDWVDKGVLGSP